MSASDLVPVRDGARQAHCICGRLFVWGVRVGFDSETFEAPCCGTTLAAQRTINWRATAYKYYSELEQLREVHENCDG